MYYSISVHVLFFLNMFILVVESVMYILWTIMRSNPEMVLVVARETSRE